MITSDGYSLIYYPNRNQIIINLPQTLMSLTNTVTIVKNRKTELSATEQGTILAVVKAIVDGGVNDAAD